jgi:hypothetical protein
LREDCGNDIDSAAEEDDFEESMEKLDEMYQQASQVVYTEKTVSIVSAVIVIINMAVIHGVSNSYVDELLKYLSTVLLPKGNHLPSSHYEVKKLIRKLGMPVQMRAYFFMDSTRIYGTARWSHARSPCIFRARGGHYALVLEVT